MVAEEIRKLADVSASSTAEITRNIRDIVAQVSRTEGNTKKLNEAFSAISDEVESTIEAFSEIGRSLEELNGGSKQVLEASEQINRVTVAVRDASKQIKQGIGTLAKNAEGLENISEAVDNGMKETSAGQQEIVISMQRILQHVSSLGDSLDTIREDFDRFVVDDRNNHDSRGEVEIAPSPKANAEVRGNIINLTGILMNNYPEVQKMAGETLKKQSGRDWQTATFEDWFETKYWDLFIRTFAQASPGKEQALVGLGRKIYPMIKKTQGFPEGIDTPLKALQFEAQGFLLHHRGPDVKPRRFLKASEGDVVVDAQAPGYHCHVYEGVFLGILDLYGIKTAKVVQTECVRHGAAACQFHITW